MTKRDLSWVCRTRAAVVAAMGIMAGGCLQAASVAPYDPDASMVYNCGSGRTFDVKRLRDEVVVVVDGITQRLVRDPAFAGAERFTNRLQTLTFFKDRATYDWPGRVRYDSCVHDGYSRDPNKRTKQENSD